MCGTPGPHFLPLINRPLVPTSADGGGVVGGWENLYLQPRWTHLGALWGEHHGTQLGRRLHLVWGSPERGHSLHLVWGCLHLKWRCRSLHLVWGCLHLKWRCRCLHLVWGCLHFHGGGAQHGGGGGTGQRQDGLSHEGGNSEAATVGSVGAWGRPTRWELDIPG